MGTLQTHQPNDSTNSLNQIGLTLHEAREQHQLSISSVAASLRLPTTVIETLESSDFNALAPVYAKGYLRSYARLLELDAEPLIQIYNQALQKDAIANPIPLPPEVGSRSSKVGYLIGIALLVPVLIWIVGKAFTPTPPVENQPTLDLVPASQIPPEKTVAEVPVPNIPPSPAGNVSSQAPTVAAVSANQPTESPQPAAQADKPALTETGTGPDQLTLHVPDVAWVSLKDADGQKLAYETLPAGTEKIFKGKAPFTLRIGHFSPDTKIEFNGQSFEAPKAKAGTAVKFTVK